MSDDKARFDKGDAVAIIGGKRDVGVRGEVFWVGPNRYGPGFRYGVKARDGRTLWVDEAHVGSEEGAPPEPPPPERPVLDKGAPVRITGGREGVGEEGEVFWVGESKFGPGMRYGVKNAEGETFWVDEAEVEALDGGGASSKATVPSSPPKAPSQGAPVAASDFDDAPLPGDDDLADFEENPPF